MEKTQDEFLRFQLWEAACSLSVGAVADSASARLREAGVPVTRTVYPGMIHGFINSIRFMGEARDGLRLIAREVAALR